MPQDGTPAPDPKVTTPGVQQPKLHPAVQYLLPSPEHQELGLILLHFVTDPRFSETFWSDPAQALQGAGLRVRADTVTQLRNADRKIIDQFVEDARNVARRSEAFTWEGETVAAFPLVAAAFFAGAAVGALASEVLHHHVQQK